MKKILAFGRAFGASFGLVLLGFIVANASALVPAAVNGPWLGDNLSNIWSLTNAHILGSGYGVGNAITTIDQSSGQSNCTATGNANMLHYLKTSASTGYICLPTANSGRFILYLNATGQTIDVYGSNTSFVPGTQDTINGTTGSTAYTAMVSGKNLLCFSPANGLWACGVIS